VQRIHLLTLQASRISLSGRIRISSASNSSSDRVNLSNHLLVVEGFFSNVPAFFLVTPSLSQSFFPSPRFRSSEIFLNSPRRPLTVGFPIPLLREEPNQPPVLYEDFNFSAERYAIFRQMPMVGMIFAKLAPIPFEWVCLHFLWPSKRRVSFYGPRTLR
jgi:hypothetical protein